MRLSMVKEVLKHGVYSKTSFTLATGISFLFVFLLYFIMWVTARVFPSAAPTHSESYDYNGGII